MILVAQQVFGGVNGFLPFERGRASLMLDVVFLAMFIVVPVLAASVWLVKQRRKYLWHKRLQLVLAAVLLAAVALFELDLRINGWQHRAEPSPYFDAAHQWTCPAGISLAIHLCCAVPTFLLWTYVVVQALRKFKTPPQPGPHSRAHAAAGWLAAVGMALTAVTGWIFYWLAFVAA